MEITKQSLMNVISQINSSVESLKKELKEKNREIDELNLYNQTLKQNNKATLDQIRQYIQELEKIRNYYADSNNNSK